jgi:hypothetical protein
VARPKKNNVKMHIPYEKRIHYCNTCESAEYLGGSVKCRKHGYTMSHQNALGCKDWKKNE